jgi:isopentenyl diphosphate isomerase/L-lactate dehydrogenase-like FMN-dependent dehydrogenase
MSLALSPPGERTARKITMEPSNESASFLERRRHEIVNEGKVTVPLSSDELRAEAERTLDRSTFDYVDGAAGRELTKRANRAGFQRWRIVPRAFRDVSDRRLGTTFFDETLAAPLFLSPVGRQSRFDERAELAAASAARSLGVPFTLSTWATHSIERVAECIGDAPCFFQLYWVNDWDVTRSFVERAEAAGYRAIVVTVDSKVPKWRARNLSNRYEASETTVAENFVTDPVVQDLFEDRDEPLAEAIVGAPELSYDQSLSWDDLSFLREHTSLPILLKGLVHPHDAARAVEYGVDGVIVSTHGGRQLDGGIGAIEALPDVVDAIDGRLPVYLDSGIRSAADTFKALALGADAVFLGRPFVYGLVLAGEQGVYEVLHNHLAELESILGLTGHSDVADLGPVDLARID